VLAGPTVISSTPLLDSPASGAGVLLALEPGAELAIDGAPEGNFYPVTAVGVSGWIDGAAPSQPEPRRNGPAAVLVDAPLLESPDAGAPLVFLVPAGSTFNLYGDEANGYLYGEFMWMFGWIDASSLDPAARVRDERIPADAETVDSRDPRPGAGVARTTVDLTLRAGPSAAEDALDVVPAGTRVELTGVMQNEFQRVVYGDQVGWLSNAYLELPVEPEPEVGRNGRPEWTEREIVSIIEAAADRYHQPREDMLRVARCESNLDPYAVNPSGSYGLFQFVRSTWESTPFADEDIFDPEANANAAGWMWKQGRRAEWVCK
ncbi:MAG: SH3 domain-containing protein, partial [Chloroflexota bacterium]